ncbi:MAG: bifunctional phosphoglucose/phosphomannose isomerase [Candidatus Methanomethylicota archaeon]|uniref:Bifunctional phosphoglucose/phosphomannose isomerase n=2 Tax=Thermoproteota archaeon TaxID=2056631 RepID=A0A497EWX0_9CREN|nr:MAG: bifunctional phosphoglucose/phosphomannose isomerase [Candidatus Verstraetearchaeota archaeon]
MKLREQIEAWHDLALKALELEIQDFKEVKPNLVAFIGLGGSGIVGDFVKALCYDVLDLPVYIVKEARLPKWVKEGSLVFAISYSGDTIETLIAVEDAVRRGSVVYVITSNGELLDYAENRKLPRVKLDEGYAPRAALPLMLYSCLNILKALGLVNLDVERSLEVLKDVKDNKAVAEKLAQGLLHNSIPAIIADARFEALAWRFKSDLNENAKISAKCEIVPESMHNDIMGYEGNRKPTLAVVLNANDQHLYTKILEEFVEEHLRELKVLVEELRLKGRDMLAKLMYGSQISSLASIALAEKQGISPEATVSIAKYKERLRKLASVWIRLS